MNEQIKPERIIEDPLWALNNAQMQCRTIQEKIQEIYDSIPDKQEAETTIRKKGHINQLEKAIENLRKAQSEWKAGLAETETE